MEQDIFLIAKQFAAECHKLEERKGGASLSIELKVSMQGRWQRTSDNDPPKVTLEASFFDGSTHQIVKAASLGALMDEVYRRATFEDREATRRAVVEADLVALPAPAPKPVDGRVIDDDIPF